MKKFLFLLLVLVLVFSLAACGGGDKDTDGQGEDSIENKEGEEKAGEPEDDNENSGGPEGPIENAGFPPVEFSGPTESFSSGGVTITYPEDLEAREGAFGGVTVNLDTNTWVTAATDTAENSLEENLETFKYFNDYKGGELRESVYNGLPCFVAINDKDEDNGKDAGIHIYVYIEEMKYVRIHGETMTEKLDTLLGNQDLMAIIASIKWDGM